MNNSSLSAVSKPQNPEVGAANVPLSENLPEQEVLQPKSQQAQPSSEVVGASSEISVKDTSSLANFKKAEVAVHDLSSISESTFWIWHKIGLGSIALSVILVIVAARTQKRLSL